jgi:hypothetical protein
MHKCVHCLADTPLPEYLANDHICDGCASEPEAFPLSSPSHFETYSPVDRLRELASDAPAQVMEDLIGAP